MSNDNTAALGQINIRIKNAEKPREGREGLAPSPRTDQS